MKLKSRAPVGAACVAALAASAGASTIPEMSLGDVYRDAGVVVHGRVVSQESHWENINGNNIIFTYSTVDVFSSLKGAAGRSVTVRTVGGNVDGYNQALIGEATISDGEEVVLFLGNEEGWPAPDVVGFYQGKYRVVEHDGEVMLAMDNGQQGTGPSRTLLETPMDEFISRLDSARATGRDDAGTTLVPIRGASQLSGDLALMSRSLERGALPSDMNRDGVVDALDLVEVADGLGAGSADADVNNDGVVDANDVADVLRNMDNGGAR